MFSYSLLKRALIIWATHWAQERGTVFNWVGHTETLLTNKLSGIFWDSKLAHIKGLMYQKGGGAIRNIRATQDWQGRIRLSGHVVICCKSKVFYSKEYETFRYKWAVSITEVYKDMERYAMKNSEAAALLFYFQKQANEEGVYFDDTIAATTRVSLSESSESSADNENIILFSQSKNTHDEYGLKEAVVSQARKSFLEKKDSVTYYAYWRAMVEIDASEDLAEEIKIQQIYSFLSTLLSFFSYVFVQSMQNNIPQIESDFGEDLDFLLGRIEQQENLESLRDEEKNIFNIGLTIFNAERCEEQEAKNTFHEVVDYVSSNRETAHNVYDYYYLSQVAFKLQEIEKAKELLEKSSTFFDGELHYDENMNFFTQHLASISGVNTAVSFFPKESSPARQFFESALSNVECRRINL